jgi:hypothetical protein
MLSFCCKFYGAVTSSTVAVSLEVHLCNLHVKTAVLVDMLFLCLSIFQTTL